ncbi:hypothetical protein JQS43_04570 [Natronosporangium hydrolyticum]|uniref:Uncharacterized protein n=1 Tax=Natronosporangium hydrolyticum TaxID=2811111 RepID=A0A895YNV5_9ACTN|nr:hypothetical protein [Natronosporangium hydrolyticum]QSB15628.1 hypothetical protein JQS43_04570 [Natronosporangium hydrolyticum]
MTARPIMADELLNLADDLVPVDAGRGRPRTVELRRAVSTAYYALFHELIRHATRELVGDDSNVELQRRQAARWFAHGDLKILAAVAAGRDRQKRALAAVLGEAHADLVRVAEAFVALQTARHRADYDHDYDVKRRDALLMVATARDAVQRVRGLEKANDESLRRFLRLMVGGVQIAKNR